MVDLEHDNSANASRETLVREYLAAELEPQVGRAEAKFHQMLAQRGSVASQAARRRAWRFPNRFTDWSLGLVGAALAASLAALWAGPSLRQIAPTPGTNAPVVQPTPLINPMYVEQRTDSQTFDDGTFMTQDNTPFRVLHRRDMERTRWFDQDQNLTGEQIMPEDHVIYVKLKTY